MDDANRGDTSVYMTRALLAVLVGLLVIMALRSAWVCDDSYIAFRTVDNFTHGYGLTWNVDERVQAFTNPLWVFVVSFFYLFTGEAYYTSIFLSLALTLLAGIVLVRYVSRSVVGAALALTILILSKAFIDYSTSGLENPLSHLLLLAFVAVFLGRPADRKSFLWLCLIAALGATNRLDTILLYLPALVWRAFKLPWKETLKTALVGFLPLILWELFSLLYYGFPFPNTYYAKLCAGIPESSMMVQGLVYYLDSFNLDPITLTVIALTFVLLFVYRRHGLWPLALGSVFYLLYIFRIGGDFMSGRFFVAPLLIAVALLARLPWPQRGAAVWLPFLAVGVLGLTAPRCPVYSDLRYGTRGEGGIAENSIADERAWYYQSTGLLRDNRTKVMPAHPWYMTGDSLRLNAVKTATTGVVGFEGYAAGPTVHVVDRHALTDALLARLPSYRNANWRPGHLGRQIPPGYFATIDENKYQLKDTGLYLYYDRLNHVICGKIWSTRRFADIWRFNTGYYDHLLSNFREKPLVTVAYADICTPVEPRTLWNAPGTFRIYGDGLYVDFDSVCHNPCLEMSVDHNDVYDVLFMLDDRELAKQTLKAKDCYGLSIDTVRVWPLARQTGYDAIHVYPQQGDGLYSVGHVRLLDDSTACCVTP